MCDFRVRGFRGVGFEGLGLEGLGFRLFHKSQFAESLYLAGGKRAALLCRRTA